MLMSMRRHIPPVLLLSAAELSRVLAILFGETTSLIIVVIQASSLIAREKEPPLISIPRRATIDINSQKYDINEIYYEDQVLKIAKADFMLNICRVSYINSTLDFNLFEYTLSDQNASLLYDCDHLTEEQPRKQEFTCPIDNRPSECYFTAPAISSDELSRRCKISLLIPVLEIFAGHFTNYLMTIDQVIKEGFEVRWVIDQERCRDCHFSGGKCGYNRTINDFTCFCPYQPSPRTCSRTQPPANSAAANPSTAPGDITFGYISLQPKPIRLGDMEKQ